MGRPAVVRTLTVACAALAFCTAAPDARAAFVPATLTREPDIDLTGSTLGYSRLAFDRTRGFIFALTRDSPAKIHVIRPATDAQPASVLSTLTLEPDEVDGLGLAIDEQRGVLYATTTRNLPQATLIKFTISDADGSLTRVATLAFAGESMWDIAFDETGNMLYVNNGSNPNRIYKYAAGEAADPVTTVGVLELPPDNTSNFHTAIDPARGLGWAACYGLPSTLVQFQLGGPNEPPTFDSSTTVPAYANGIFEGVLNPRNMTLFLTSYAQDGVLKYDVSGPQPVLRGFLPLGPAGDSMSCIAVDPDNGFGVAGPDTFPATAFAFATGGLFHGPGLISTAEVDNRNLYHSAVIDMKNRRAYFAAETPHVVVVKLTGEPGSGVDLGGTFLKSSAKTKGASTTIKAQAQISNTGTADSGVYFVRSYLSRDRILDPSDSPIGKDRFVKTLKSGKSRKAPVSAKLPALASGRYYVITVADPEDLTNDENRADNVIVSEPIDL